MELIIYIKMYLALNNLQRLISHKTKPNKTKLNYMGPIDWNLSGATTLGKCRPGSDGNEEGLQIPQSSDIIGASSSDCLLLSRTLVGGVLPFCRDAISA